MANIDLEKLTLLYEGKAKQVYQTDDKETYIVHYKDDATAFNGEKHDTILGKGVLNNKISSFFFELLKKEGVPTHFVRREDDRNQTVLTLNIVPLEVIVRNIAAGSMAKRFGIEEGTPLKHPILEFCYKNDELGDPFANESQITALGWATQEQLDTISEITMKVNDILKNFLATKNVTLVDFKLLTNGMKNVASLVCLTAPLTLHDMYIGDCLPFNTAVKKVRGSPLPMVMKWL